MNIEIEKLKICKAEKVIDMIQDAENRIARREEMKRTKSFFFYEPQILQREINNYEAIITRLENYYKNIFA